MQTFLIEAPQNKCVDRILCPARYLHLRHGGTYRLFKRPVGPVMRAFRHPLLKNGDFLGFHWLCFAQRSLRHQVVWILGFNPPDQFALFGMPGHNGIRFPWPLLEGRLFQVEPQVGLPHLRIGTVATKTVAGQDRLHILVEVKMLLRAEADSEGLPLQPAVVASKAVPIINEPAQRKNVGLNETMFRAKQQILHVKWSDL